MEYHFYSHSIDLLPYGYGIINFYLILINLDFHRKAFLILLSTFAKGIRAIILIQRA
jgi:hypothetical protein